MTREYVTYPILNATNLPWPTDWSSIFDEAHPLILDVGFGYGHSLVYLHRTRPHHNIIGLEVDNTSLRKAERAVFREGWYNVRVVHAFAESTLYHLLEPETLDEVHVNFPDPWFKSRHAGRRLMKRMTVDAITSRLRPGGRFYLATDIAEYAEMSHELLAETTGLTNVLDAPWRSERPEPLVTKYERRAQQEGRPCHYFVYERNAHPAPDIPVIKELAMPHIVFTSPLDLDTMMQRIPLESYQDEQRAIKFIDRYRGERTLLFEVYVHEPTLDQRVALLVVEREDTPHEYTLKLSSLGHPRPTSGVHKAVRLLGDNILSMHPDVQVIHDKVQK